MTTSGGARPWVREHLERYVETDGADGHIWRGVPTLLLTTIGRKSGNPATTPLIYGEDAGRYVVVASRGGAPVHPQWFLNLEANPSVGAQVAADKFRATARVASPDEKPALWRLMTSIYPPYDEYQAATEREIPVVILEREE